MPITLGQTAAYESIPDDMDLCQAGFKGQSLKDHMPSSGFTAHQENVLASPINGT